MILVRILRKRDDLVVLCDLQRAALQKIDHVLTVFSQVDGKLDVHGIIVLRLKSVQYLAEILHHGLVFDHAVAGNIPDIPVGAHVAEIPLGLVIVGQQLPLQIEGQAGLDLPKIHAGKTVLLRVDQVDLPLGKLMPLRRCGDDLPGRCVHGNQSRVRALHPVDGRRAKAHDQAQHARTLLHIPAKLVGTHGIADARGGRQEIMTMARARNPLHQKRHLLVLLLKPPPLAVFQGAHAQGAGVNGADGVLKFLQILFAGARIGAEDRLILARKRISEAVLQNTAGAHDKRILAVIVQKPQKLLLEIRGERSALQKLCHLRRKREIILLLLLPYPHFPEMIVNDIGIKNIAADVKRIVRLQA